EHFAARNPCCERCFRCLRFQPCQNLRCRHAANKLGHYIGIENDHSSNSLPVKAGGSGIGSRTGNSNSIPPDRSTRARMALTRAAPELASGEVLNATRKMFRASSSIERPCRAARTRRRAFTSSSRFRIVMLAMGKSSESDCNDCIVIKSDEQDQPQGATGPRSDGFAKALPLAGAEGLK